jgi:short-subunit dehydrogenase
MVHSSFKHLFSQKNKFMDFRGKTIWITGASSGIGKAVSAQLAGPEVKLLLSGRNQEALEEVASICREKGSETRILLFDLAREEEVRAVADEVLGEKLQVDALYHFGGISQRSFAVETPLEVDRKIFEVNYFGTIALTKYMLPSMINNGGGHIAVTSSIVGKFGFPYRSAYSASKHALHGFFESLRAENIDNNIIVSVIIPGRINTNISVNALDKKGNKYGVMDHGQDSGMTAERSAQLICRKLSKEKKEILVGGIDLLMVQIRRFFPALYYYLSSRVKPL